MKRIVAVLTAILLVGSLYSCKPREKCPAYGYHKTAHPAAHTVAG